MIGKAVHQINIRGQQLGRRRGVRSEEGLRRPHGTVVGRRWRTESLPEESLALEGVSRPVEREEVFRSPPRST